MGGTTPIQSYPYPTGTDRVRDGDNAIEALARALDTDMGNALGPYGHCGLDSNQGPVASLNAVFVGAWVSRFVRGGFTVNVNGLVAPVAGTYEVSAWTRLSCAATTSNPRLIIGNGASAIIGDAYGIGPLSAAYNTSLYITRVTSLGAGEQIRCGFFQSVASTITMVGGAALTGLTARLLARS